MEITFFTLILAEKFNDKSKDFYVEFAFIS